MWISPTQRRPSRSFILCSASIPTIRASRTTSSMPADNPQMAQQGLEAARRYASIAPAAPHALHMPSHIFARLGLWDDDIRSNLASKAAAENPTAHVGAENRLHAMEFLEYAFLQIGRDDEARADHLRGADGQASGRRSTLPRLITRTSKPATRRCLRSRLATGRWPRI